ncbi:hypothetical protein HHK36_006054 [Tetracentron sinense]|uniref:Uncharacterized protein n=1 Tax=Tetracentron sinense TaxID=13715 RepID=A0A835DKI3_TETSI|nr:hypothetical protein HHK36_006054 [Tetracentron sinense]
MNLSLVGGLIKLALCNGLEILDGAHFNFVCNFIKMFDVTCSVLQNIIKDRFTYSQRGDANAAYDSMTSFEFILILHLMQEIMGITDNLCQALQSQSQDILNVLDLVSTTKVLLQELREDGWDPWLKKVTSFCNQYDVDIPDMNDCYATDRGRFRHQHDHITMGHHYKFDIFTATIDSQLQELNRRFNEHTMELLVLSSALDPRDSYKSFKIDDICKLVDKFYLQDFTKQDKIHLRYQLQHYEHDVPQHPQLRNMLIISGLCQGFSEDRKISDLSSCGSIDSPCVDSSSFDSNNRKSILSNEDSQNKVLQQDGG